MYNNYIQSTSQGVPTIGSTISMDEEMSRRQENDHEGKSST